GNGFNSNPPKSCAGLGACSVTRRVITMLFDVLYYTNQARNGGLCLAAKLPKFFYGILEPVTALFHCLTFWRHTETAEWAAFTLDQFNKLFKPAKCPRRLNLPRRGLRGCLKRRGRGHLAAKDRGGN